MHTHVAIIGGSIAALRAAHECTRDGVPWLMLVAADHLGDGHESLRRGGCVLDHRPAIIGGDEDEWVSWDESILAGVGPTPPMVIRFRHAGQFHEMADPLRHAFASRLARWRGLLGSGLDGNHWSAVARLTQAESMWRRSEAGSSAGAHAETVTQALESASAPRSLTAAVLPLVRMLGLDPNASGSARAAAHAWRGGTFGPAMYETGVAGLLDHVGAGLPVLSHDRAEASSGVLLDHPVNRMDLSPDGARLHVGDDRVHAHAVVIATVDRPWDHRHRGQSATPSTATVHYLLAQKSLPAVLAGGALVVSDEEGPINHLVATSEVAPGCAPAARALVACTVIAPAVAALGDVGVDRAVRAQLESWLGAPAMSGWRTVAVQRSARGPASSEEPVSIDPTGPVVECDPGALLGALVEQVRAGRLAAQRAMGSLVPSGLPRKSST